MQFVLFQLMFYLVMVVVLFPVSLVKQMEEMVLIEEAISGKGFDSRGGHIGNF